MFSSGKFYESMISMLNTGLYCFKVLQKVKLNLIISPLLYRSSDFRQSFSRIHELRAFVRPGTPMLAATATVTKEMRLDVIDKLDMKGCEYISASPNKPNIMYLVCERTSIEDDLAFLVEDLRENNTKAKRVIVYCRSLNMCSFLYAHFLYELKEKSYYPPWCRPD